MTPEQIIAAIKANPTLIALAEQGRDGEIAQQIAPEQRPKSFLLTTAAVLKLFNRQAAPHAGGVILKKLRDLAATNTPVGNNSAEIVRLMDGEGWELMDNATAAILADWKTANVVNDPQIAAIKDLAFESVRPHFSEVSKALKPYRPEGKVGALVNF